MIPYAFKTQNTGRELNSVSQPKSREPNLRHEAQLVAERLHYATSCQLAVLL